LITIQSALFLALGFLVASLLWLLAAPAFWSRAVRLTARRIREAMPLSEAEIRADKDRLRAEYALKIHEQQLALDETKLAAARQLIELNRRDARINSLEADVESLQASLEGAVNARSVLEQTVAERLPRVEERLAEAKRHLQQRDKEIADLTRSAERQARALQEAEAINEQLRREIKSLATAVEAAGGKARGKPAEDRTDTFVAMRAELEALRSRTREQAAMIDRLQKAHAASVASGAAGDKANGAAAASLRPGVLSKASDDSERKLREARQTIQSHEREIARLKATVAVYEKSGKSELPSGSTSESRIALKASLSALENKTLEQENTIDMLKAEIAALQEQLTRQAAEHLAQVSRLGSGTKPAGAAQSVETSVPPSDPAPRERRSVPRLTLAERVAQSRRDTPDDARNDDTVTTPVFANNAADAGAASPAAAKAKPSSEAITEIVVTPAENADASGDRRPSRIKARLLDRISDLSKA
jgi:uncharacterized coiled-coil protein SlyX